jgi:hypothetical protein
MATKLLAVHTPTLALQPFGQQRQQPVFAAKAIVVC